MCYLESSFSRGKMLFVSIYVALEKKIVLLVSVGVAQHRKQTFLPDCHGILFLFFVLLSCIVCFVSVNYLALMHCRIESYLVAFKNSSLVLIKWCQHRCFILRNLSHCIL